MRIGIVGFASSGKSTLFQLLTGAKPDHAAVHSGQVGVAAIPDPRLDVLKKMYEPDKVTPATLELLDTPGLDPRGGHENPQVLGLMRSVDGLLIVLGQYLGGDPADEMRRLNDELGLSDLALLSGRVEKLEANLKKPRPEKEREATQHEIDRLRHLIATLESGAVVANLMAADREAVRGYQLFMAKPRYVVLNVSEVQVGAADAPWTTLVQQCRAHGGAAVLAAKLELELQQLDAAERASFMADLGIQELARDHLLTELARGTMGQITFLTAGPKEVRGWPVHVGASAVEAAGKIHTDLARGFIRAEVIHYDDLVRAGSEKEAKRHNLYRLEGKDYVVKDGDVLLIRFSV
jgi:hypothetical protein